MKKIISMLTVLIMVMGLTACGDEGTGIYVSISDAGSLKMAHQLIKVTDVDSDKVLTISDAITCAHKAAFDGGEEGFVWEMGDYGPVITRLWGAENGGSYGYYLNDQMPMGLMDPVKEGDHVYVYGFADLSGYSDAYCTITAEPEGQGLKLTLSAYTFDESFNTVLVPVENATITVDGNDSGIITSEDGTAYIEFTDSDSHVISAVTDALTIVPPVYVVEGK